MHVPFDLMFSTQHFCQIASCHRCQMFSKIKTQAPELIPIKVHEPLELVGIDLIGEYFFMNCYSAASI